MKKHEARLAALEDAYRDSPTNPETIKRLLALRRVRTGTASADDYELVMPGVLHHACILIGHAATVLRFAHVIGRDQHVRPSSIDPGFTHEERLAARKEEQTFWMFYGQRPPCTLWIEELDACEGPELDAVAQYCMTFEHEPPLLDQLQILLDARDGDDVAAKVRANLCLTAISCGHELQIRRDIERGLPRSLHSYLYPADRSRAMKEAGCRLDHFRQNVPLTCCSPNTAKRCICQHQYPFDESLLDRSIEEEQENIAIQLGAIGVRVTIPTTPEEDHRWHDGHIGEGAYPQPWQSWKDT